MKNYARFGFVAFLFLVLIKSSFIVVYADEIIEKAKYSGHNKTIVIRYAIQEDNGTLKLSVTETDVKIVALVAKDGKEGYHYRLRPGERALIPLTQGDGTYKITVFLHVMDTMYEEIWSTDVDVRLKNKFAPFLMPSKMVSWSGDSPLAQKAAELADGKTDEEAALAICDYIVGRYRYYDWNPPPNYVPNADDVFEADYGICYDFATLYTAMCRSVGIPCMLVTGYSRYMGMNKYHSWGEVYVNGRWRMVDPSYSIEQGTKFLNRGKTTVKYIF